MGKKGMLLILDLDDTLIYGRKVPLERPPDFRCGPYFIYERPCLREFVAGIRDDFEVAVWSSGTADYVNCIVEHVFGPRYPMAFVWTRERCTPWLDPETEEALYLKDLKKVRRQGYPIEQILVVDEDRRALSRSHGNLLQATPFHGDVSDKELAALLQYLRSMANIPDVRKVDKRAWRIHAWEKWN